MDAERRGNEKLKAEDEAAHKALRIKDAQIEKLKALIGELTDALEDQTNIGFGKECQDLIGRAREATQTNPHP